MTHLAKSLSFTAFSFREITGSIYQNPLFIIKFIILIMNNPHYYLIENENVKI